MTPPTVQWLRASGRVLAERYDVALLDLDGVVYLGQAPVPGAAAYLESVRAQGMQLGFVTNNASRSPRAIVEHLRELGVRAEPAEIITSAQTASRVLAERLAPGDTVLVVGSEALAEEVRGRGLTPVFDLVEGVAAVVQGYSPDTGWRALAAACRAVRDGAWWVATNADYTVPSVDGQLPGNGSFVDVVARTTGHRPLVTGKPEPAMHRECVERTGSRRPLVVGDRLDTDIEGAVRVGCDSLLVLTGVTDVSALLAAGREHRPTYVATDLGGLLAEHPAPARDHDGWRCGGWSVRPTPRELQLSGAGAPIDAVRALCAAAWTEGLHPVAAHDVAAEAMVTELGVSPAQTKRRGALTASSGA